MPSEQCFKFFSGEIVALRKQSPKPPTIDTESNLWPQLLHTILDRLDLAGEKISIDEPKLKTLVARRNDIAHGQKVFITDLTYYLEYEQAVAILMDELAIAIVNRAAKYITQGAA